MVNIAPIHQQQKDEAQTKEILDNPYQEVVWLKKKYKSLHRLCEIKKIPYATVYSRLKNGKTLTESILNCEYYNNINNVMRLYNSGSFTIAEICRALHLGRRTVENIISSNT